MTSSSHVKTTTVRWLAILAALAALALPVPGAAQDLGADVATGDAALTPHLRRLGRLLRGDVPDRLGVLDALPTRRFGASRGPASIAAVYADCQLVSLRAHAFGDMTLATDLAADLAEAGVPEGVVASVTPPDGDSARNADFIASRWAVEQLGAGPGDEVGLLAFFGQARLPGAADRPPTLHLVLVRGEVTADGSRPVALRYGSMTTAITHRAD